MVFSSVEIIALVFSVILIIKLLFIVFSPKSWASFQSSIFKHPKIVSVIALVLAAIVLNFLLKEVSITQIFASLAFFSLLVLSGIVLFGDQIMKFKDSLIENFSFRKYWWHIIIWLLLVLWVLEEVLT